MTTTPLRPSDPRPGGVPFYITKECGSCGTALVLGPNNEGWMDEFVCPVCNDGVYLDVPKEVSDRILARRRKHGNSSPR